MSHPSLFELDVFIRRGATSVDFERHVSACDACAARLSGLARRARPASLVLAVPQERRFQAAAVALAACLAVLVARSVSLPPASPERHPEGLHGVMWSAPAAAVIAGGFGDGGPLDSGVR